MSCFNAQFLLAKSFSLCVLSYLKIILRCPSHRYQRLLRRSIWTLVSQQHVPTSSQESLFFVCCSDFRSALRCLESSGFNECPSLQLYFSQRTADKRKHKEILERGCADLPELQGGDSSAAKGDFERNPQVKRLTLRRGRRITWNETRYVLEPMLLSISESSGFSFFLSHFSTISESVSASVSLHCLVTCKFYSYVCLYPYCLGLKSTHYIHICMHTDIQAFTNAYKRTDWKDG